MTTYSREFNVKELPETRCIKRYANHSVLPEIPEGTVAIFVGAHHVMTSAEQAAIDAFCASNDAVVYCDHTSGYYGKYRVNFSLVAAQNNYSSSALQVNTLIHIGEVSGDYYTMRLRPERVWRVSDDGELRDTFRRLEGVFEMREIDFFRVYTEEGVTQETQLNMRKNERAHIYGMIREIPFSNMWMAYNFAPKIPRNSVVHFGILNSLRSWNMFELSPETQSWSNVGGFGIDGNTSTLLGAALCRPEKLFFGIVGDLSFFYDLNCWGNRHLPSNIRLMLVNNGRGQEFCNYDNVGRKFGEQVLTYIAAGNHYGKKSRTLVQHYAEDLGIQYLSATNKQEAEDAAQVFFSESSRQTPIIFEIFTDGEDENTALESIRSLANHINMKDYEMPGASTGKRVLTNLRRFCGTQKRRGLNILRE